MFQDPLNPALQLPGYRQNRVALLAANRVDQQDYANVVTPIQNINQSVADRSIPLAKLDQAIPAQFDAVVTKDHVGDTTLINYNGTTYYRIADVITAAIAAGQVSLALFIRSGTYSETTQLGTSSDGVNLELIMLGESRGNTIIQLNATSSTEPSWSFDSSVQIQNLTLSKTSSVKPLLCFRGADNNVTGCDISNTQLHATSGESGLISVIGNNTTVQDCTLTPASAAGSFSASAPALLGAIQVGASVSGFTMLSCVGTCDGTMVSLASNAQNMQFIGNRMSATSSKGTFLHTDDDIYYVSITNNTWGGLSGAGYGVYFSFATNTLTHQISISGNSFLDSTAGVLLIGGGVTITGNVFKSNTRHLDSTAASAATDYNWLTFGDNICVDGTVYLVKGRCTITGNTMSFITASASTKCIEGTGTGMFRMNIEGNELYNGIMDFSAVTTMTSVNIIGNTLALGGSGDEMYLPTNMDTSIIANNLVTNRITAANTTTGVYNNVHITGNNSGNDMSLGKLEGCLVEGNHLGGLSIYEVTSTTIDHTDISNNIIVNDLDIIGNFVQATLSYNHCQFGDITMLDVTDSRIIGNKCLRMFIDSLGDSILALNYMSTTIGPALELFASSGTDASIINGNYMDYDEVGSGNSDYTVFIGGSLNGKLAIVGNYIRNNNTADDGHCFYVDAQFGSSAGNAAAAITVIGNIFNGVGDQYGFKVSGNCYNLVYVGNGNGKTDTATTGPIPIQITGTLQESIIDDNRLTRGASDTVISIGTSTNNYIPTPGVGLANLTR